MDAGQLSERDFQLKMQSQSQLQMQMRVDCLRPDLRTGLRVKILHFHLGRNDRKAGRQTGIRHERLLIKDLPFSLVISGTLPPSSKSSVKSTKTEDFNGDNLDENDRV